MKSMTLADGDAFTLDAYYTIDTGKIITDFMECDLVIVDIHKIRISFADAGTIDILTIFSDEQLEVFREQIIYWESNSK